MDTIVPIVPYLIYTIHTTVDSDSGQWTVTVTVTVTVTITSVRHSKYIHVGMYVCSSLLHSTRVK